MIPIPTLDTVAGHPSLLDLGYTEMQSGEKHDARTLVSIAERQSKRLEYLQVVDGVKDRG